MFQFKYPDIELRGDSMNDFDTPISLDDLTEMRDHLRDFLAPTTSTRTTKPTRTRSVTTGTRHHRTDDRIRERKLVRPCARTTSAADFEGRF